jgi:hypothetical protein
MIQRGWVSLRLQDLLHQNYTSTNESVKGLINRERIASWNWEIDLDKPCPGINKTNVAMAMKRKVSVMVCFETMQEVVGKDIADAVNFEEIKATVIETIVKSKARGEEVADGRLGK